MFGCIIMIALDMALLMLLVKLFSDDEVPWQTAAALAVGVSLALSAVQGLAYVVILQTENPVLGLATLVGGSLALGVGLGVVMSVLIGMSMARAIGAGLILVGVHIVVAVGLSLLFGLPRREAIPTASSSPRSREVVTAWA